MKLSRPLTGLALVVATACGDSSANDGSSSFDETNGGSLEAPGDGDPGDGDPGDGDPGDGDGESGDGDGDPGDGDPGDGDGDPAPGCGDGMLDPGEACDDGNNEPGDGCSMYCQLPGELIWEVVTDLDSQLDEAGWAVAVDDDGSTNVIVEQGFGYLLARFDHEGEWLWTTNSIATERPSLVIGMGGQLVAGGQLGTQGIARAWDSSGDDLWTAIITIENSGILGLAVDVDGNVIGSGYHPGPNGFLARWDGRGEELWVQMQLTAGRLGPVAAGDQIWAAREETDALERYALEDGAAEAEISPLDGDVVRDVILDDAGDVYVLTEAADQASFSVARYTDGALAWIQTYGGGDVTAFSVGGLALLPGGGGLLVAGSSTIAPDTSDGLLVWYDLDGGQLAEDVVIDIDEVDALHDVAVTPYNYAVAVGERRAAGADADLWIRKFEI